MKSISVLIADNHQRARRTLAKVLGSDKRLRIIGEAANGEEAIAKAHDLHPDVILMDVNMPKMDGLQSIRHLKDHYPETKVIVLSASNEKSLINEAIQLGANAYLLKEYGIEDIVQTISSEFRKIPSAKQSASKSTH